MRRIGLLINLARDDPELQARRAAFQQGLQQLGWTDGVNVRIIAHWGGGAADHLRRSAAELVAFAPDVILATSSPALAALQQATQTIPLVFVSVVDPVGGGFVASLTQPGGNTTGFALFEYALSGKWLQLLKQIAPRLTRAAVLRDAGLATAFGQVAAIEAVAPSLELEVVPVAVRDAHEIERAVRTFGHGSDCGLIVTGSTLTAMHRDLIVALAARHRLPAVYPFRYFARSGGLISYGPDTIAPCRLAAGYVDRILRGERPADLPVEQPSRYELVVNLQAAKALGIAMPDALLTRADEVIE